MKTTEDNIMIDPDQILNAHSPEVQNHYLMRLVDQPSKELVDVIIKLVTLQKHWAEQEKKASRTS